MRNNVSVVNAMKEADASIEKYITLKFKFTLLFCLVPEGVDFVLQAGSFKG